MIAKTLATFTRHEMAEVRISRASRPRPKRPAIAAESRLPLPVTCPAIDLLLGCEIDSVPLHGQFAERAVGVHLVDDCAYLLDQRLRILRSVAVDCHRERLVEDRVADEFDRLPLVDCTLQRR